MTPLTISIEAQLPNEIARIDPRDPRHQGTISATIKSVAGVACRLRTGVAARQRNKLSRFVEATVDRRGAAQLSVGTFRARSRE